MKIKKITNKPYLTILKKNTRLYNRENLIVISLFKKNPKKRF